MVDELCGVILAAGAGHRIRPLSFAYPKPMLPVCNKPIIEHQVQQMANLGIREVYIVVGKMSQQITLHFGDGSRWGLRVHYVDQPDPKGIAHALSMLESHLCRPMLVFLGDIFFVSANLQDAVDLFYENRAAAVLAVKRESDAQMIKRNFSVEVQSDGRVFRVVEKPQVPPNDLKGCGLYLFQPVIFDAIRNTAPSSLRNECELTDAVQTLIDLGLPVYASEAVDWDANVTNARDLLMCNLRELARLKIDNLVGNNVSLPVGIELRRAIIGDNVVITTPTTIEDSMIFSNARVDPRKSLFRSIVMHVDLEIACREDGPEVIVLR